MRERRTNIRIRQMRPIDLANILPLAREASCRSHLDIEWLRHHTMDDPIYLPALCLVASNGQEIVGFCFGCMRDEKGVIKLFGTAPMYRRTGIASALFEEIEGRSREQGVSKITVGGVAPNYFCPGVPLCHTAAISFLLQRGYETDRRTRVDLIVDLQAADLDTASVEAGLAEDGILLRRAGEDKIEEVATFVERHFSAIWCAKVEDSSRFHPPPLFVALKEDRYVAFAAYDVTGISRFGPTGTHPRYRHQGIGSALLKRCLQSMRVRGDDTAEIGWAGPIDYYARLVSARIHKAYWTFHKMLPKS